MHFGGLFEPHSLALCSETTPGGAQGLSGTFWLHHTNILICMFAMKKLKNTDLTY